MRLRWPALALLLAVAVGACSGTGAASIPAGTAAVDLTVYAAASLKTALDRVRTAYQAAAPGTTLSISTDSSAALETKIEQGAPADVFLSADTKNPQRLVDGGYASGSVVPFAGNQLTVIVPAANPAGITTPVDLARSGVKIVAAADGVPIQAYAARLVANLATQPGYPADFAARYDANVVSREDNVGSLVAKVALGEADAGIVYVTDAKSSPKVTAIAVPDAANVPATYGGVVVKASPDQAAANAFLAWLAGPAGQSILASLGFLPAS
jgi:molybdate transport system substrate-binding protein